MTPKDSKNIRLLLFVIFSLILAAADGIGEWNNLSREEDLEFTRQLKLINKPAIKSFRTEYDDIVDCVDINKQLAFDHPLLKNHKVQMKPSRIPKSTKNTTSAETLLQYFPRIKQCPSGSVPIRRATKEDLIVAKYLKPLKRGSPPNNRLLNNSFQTQAHGHHFAVINYEDITYGAKAQFNVWNPIVSDDQYSIASTWIVKGPRGQENTIVAGWAVNPTVLKKKNSRLYTFWTANGYKSGCFNILCPGFVQVSSRIFLGYVLKPVSIYMDHQYHIEISIFRDRKTKNWLFMYGTEYVGYWPKEIFTSLAEGGAASAAWGGEVYSPKSTSPSMGSGHFPEEGYGKAAYIRQIKVIADKDSTFYDPDESFLHLGVDKPTCYNAVQKFGDDAAWLKHIYYGGPGNCVT